MSNVASLHRRVACLGTLLCLVLLGCGGSNHGGEGGSTDSNYTFNTENLGCNQSLDIGIKSGTFPAGSTVQFRDKITGDTIDGGAVAIDNGTELDCGFPAGATTGEYEVLLNGTMIGTVKNNCSSS